MIKDTQTKRDIAEAIDVLSFCRGIHLREQCTGTHDQFLRVIDYDTGDLLYSGGPYYEHEIKAITTLISDFNLMRPACSLQVIHLI